MNFLFGIAYSLGILLPEETEMGSDGFLIWKDWLYIPIFGISIAGIFGFAYKKPIGKQKFWKTWFVLILLLDTLSMTHDYFSGFWNMEEMWRPAITITLIIAFILPYYLALYFYGHKSEELWKPLPTPPQ